MGLSGRKPRKPDAGENPFWITYSDLLSSLVMVFLVLLLAFQAQTMQRLKQAVMDKEEADRLRAIAQKYQEQAQSLGLDRDAEALDDLLGELHGLQQKYPTFVKSDPETGEILIDDQILFASGSAELSRRGKEVLKQVIPAWAQIVTRPKYGHIIKGVIFEGHADTRGLRDLNHNYLANLELTSKRSEAVARFVFAGCRFDDQDELRLLISASGRSNAEALKNLADQARLTNDGQTIPQIWTRKTAWSLQSRKDRRVGLRLTLRNPLYRWNRGGTSGA